jgi:hypothetical protein
MLAYIIKIGDYRVQCLKIPVVCPFVAVGWYEFDDFIDTCVIDELFLTLFAKG